MRSRINNVSQFEEVSFQATLHKPRMNLNSTKVPQSVFFHCHRQPRSTQFLHRSAFAESKFNNKLE